MNSVWIPLQLTKSQCEQRRQAAAARFPQVQAGKLSEAQLAREFGVSRQSINRWYRAWRRRGLAGLTAKPCPGRPARLLPRQWRVLTGELQRGALAAGFPTECWTLKRIAQHICRRFGVRYHYRYLERPLKAHGFSLQRPPVQARERDEALVEAFLRRDWPALKKRLTAKGASLPVWTRRVTRFGPA